VLGKSFGGWDIFDGGLQLVDPSLDYLPPKLEFCSLGVSR
jgi:hypothetical protein